MSLQHLHFTLILHLHHASIASLHVSSASKLGSEKLNRKLSQTKNCDYIYKAFPCRTSVLTRFLSDLVWKWGKWEKVQKNAISKNTKGTGHLLLVESLSTNFSSDNFNFSASVKAPLFHHVFVLHGRPLHVFYSSK